MFAVMGYIVPTHYELNGLTSPPCGVKSADVPKCLDATAKVPALGWPHILIFILGKPGNYGAGLPSLSAKKLNAELAPGRLAVLGILGMLFQDDYADSSWGAWSLYTDSPLRAVVLWMGSQIEQPCDDEGNVVQTNSDVQDLSHDDVQEELVPISVVRQLLAAERSRLDEFMRDSQAREDEMSEMLMAEIKKLHKENANLKELSMQLMKKKKKMQNK